MNSKNKQTTESQAARFTPGPWRVDDKRGLNRFGGFSIAADGSSHNSLAVADTWDMSGHGDGMANARLIAAAPDMVEALRECITEDGALGMRNIGFAQKRLAAINDIARAILARVAND